MIIVEPSSGLCSRIFVLCDAYDLAKQYHQKLVILWVETADCNCGYFDIFDSSQFHDINCKVVQFKRYGHELKDADNFKTPAGFVLFLKEIVLRIQYTFSFYPIRLYYRLRSSMHKNAYADGNVALNPESVKSGNSYIEAYNGIHHKHDVSSACFSKEALEEADSILEAAHGNCIGVHIRRTDHEPAKGSLTDDFISKMQTLLEEDNSLYFYLATDDWSEQEKLISIFGKHIITQKEKVLTRSTEQGMHSSLIDFLCLSKTRYILGSYSSMFSAFSAKLGDIPLIII